jgi:hypothetical protein
MKRIVSSLLLLATMGVAFTGCLKDKGFDNHEYGINDPDTQPPGVGFPLAANARNLVGLVISTQPQDATNIIYVNLEGGQPAGSDITITIDTISKQLIDAYNLANNTNIQILDPSRYTVARTITIPAGSRNAQIPITIPNTAVLNPNISYGLGFTITSVSSGYTVAQNLKNLLVVFNLKNKYDGEYNMTGSLVDNLGQATGLYPIRIWLETVNATDVLFSNREYLFAAPNGFNIHPVNIGGVSGFGSFCPVFKFDLSNDKVVSVVNYFGQPSSNGRSAQLDPTGINQWDATTRDVSVKYQMWQASFSSTIPRVIFTEVFDYLRPRP